jgi:hypothetical protein
MALERRCDLHTHTTHSDGTFTPVQLVELAKASSISCISVTDHDTATGVGEAQSAGQRLGVEVISGIEVSAQFEPGTLHILGYFIDWRSKALLEKLEEVQEARRTRNPKIVEKLRALGFDISLEEVRKESGGEQVGRPHFARVLINKGYVKNFEEAFDKYLTKGAAAYVNKRRLSSREAIEMIIEAGGLAVLAHPKQMQLDSEPKKLEGEIERLKAEGLLGIEAYSSCQSKEEAAGYQRIAEKLKLFVTGGSDFHGTNHPDIQLGFAGDGVFLNYEAVDRMKQILLDRKIK